MASSPSGARKPVTRCAVSSRTPLPPRRDREAPLPLGEAGAPAPGEGGGRARTSAAREHPSPLDKASPSERGSPRPDRPDRSIGWLLRHLLSIGLVHVVVLAAVYFLLLLGDAL